MPCTAPQYFSLNLAYLQAYARSQDQKALATVSVEATSVKFS